MPTTVELFARATSSTGTASLKLPRDPLGSQILNDLPGALASFRREGCLRPFEVLGQTTVQRLDGWCDAESRLISLCV
jgi:hypothetical protein